jgi:hypothetical protein
MLHNLLRSITWTEVDAAFPVKNPLRRFIRRLARASSSVVSIRQNSIIKQRSHTMAHYWNGKESRWGDRVKVNIPVRLSADTLAGAEGCMRNLSLSGALVKAKVDLGLHSLIEVSIEMPSQRAEAVTACVSRRFQEGVGIEWCEFAPSVIKDLLRSPSIPFPG